MNDRIRLAEAMGWVHSYDNKPDGMIMNPPNGWWIDTDGGWSVTLDFDPFTDANDDYAVLEWARNNWLTRNPPHPDQPEWNLFCDAIWDIPTLFGSLLFYKIGDYARAALKVLDE